MKRISDFEDCRMDMKKMAALNGGAATTGSDSMRTYEGCGDLAKTTWKDGYGMDKLYYEYDYKLEIIMADCPDGYVVTDSSFATSYQEYCTP